MAFGQCRPVVTAVGQCGPVVAAADRWQAQARAPRVVRTRYRIVHEYTATGDAYSKRRSPDAPAIPHRVTADCKTAPGCDRTRPDAPEPVPGVE